MYPAFTVKKVSNTVHGKENWMALYCKIVWCTWYANLYSALTIILLLKISNSILIGKLL